MPSLSEKLFIIGVGGVMHMLVMSKEAVDRMTMRAASMFNSRQRYMIWTV
jgi:phosphoribosyl-AMP cyclohydrolase